MQFTAIVIPVFRKDEKSFNFNSIESILFGLTLPLWFGKNKARMDVARAEMKKAQAAQQDRINDTRTKIRNLFFRLENSRRLMKLYGEELLPQAARSMEIAETWYREGESTFSDFIETQAVWYNFQLAFTRAQADYGKFLARLDRLVGRKLNHKTETAAERRARSAGFSGPAA